MIAPDQVTMLTEVDQEYMAELRAVTNLGELRAFGLRWLPWAWDGWESIRLMEAEDWVTYQGATAMERRGKFAGEEMAIRFGAIWMPETLLKVSSIALEYKVPFGVAFCQLRAAGRVHMIDGRCVINLNEEVS